MPAGKVRTHSQERAPCAHSGRTAWTGTPGPVRWLTLLPCHQGWCQDPYTGPPESSKWDFLVPVASGRAPSVGIWEQPVGLGLSPPSSFPSAARQHQTPDPRPMPAADKLRTAALAISLPSVGRAVAAVTPGSRGPAVLSREEGWGVGSVPLPPTLSTTVLVQRGPRGGCSPAENCLGAWGRQGAPSPPLSAGVHLPALSCSSRERL